MKFAPGDRIRTAMGLDWSCIAVTEIIHLFGHSCAGKRTLIKALCDPGNAKLRSRFGITGEAEAFFDIGPDDHAFPHQAKWRPIQDLHSATAKHLLHKWQFASQPVISELKLTRPDVLQRGFVLWRTVDDSIRRIKAKGWWNPPPDRSRMRSELRKLQEHVAAAVLPVEYVDAADPMYRAIPGVPEII